MREVNRMEEGEREDTQMGGSYCELRHGNGGQWRVREGVAGGGRVQEITRGV
jgi:hypothetical protein